MDDDSNKKEKVEMKEQTEEDKSDKNIEEGGGEESVGRRHWSQFNYRSTTVSWLMTFTFDFKRFSKKIEILKIFRHFI